MNEKIKKNSNYLRGPLAEDLKNQLTGSVSGDSHQLIKFHGIYEQDDRDRRSERAAKKLEKDYSFMIRLRIPGGRISSDQWLGIHQIAEENSTGVIKITTRQTVQLHGVIKSTLKPTVQYFDKYGLDSIAACGDVNRNVIATVFGRSDELYEYAVKVSEAFLPQTNAYKEIWLDGEKVQEDHEPLYGDTYLPRKFKIALALPPFNDVDVYAHDIGIIGITDSKGTITGFNLSVGGGMGMTHGNPNTYPRLGSLIGYVPKNQLLDSVREIITIQRDYGNREDRKQARLKYTIDRLGLEWFIQELGKRQNFKLEKPKKFEFKERGDRYGWEGNDYCMFLENGRVTGNLKEALYQIAQKKLGNFKFTNNQNVIITDIKDKKTFNEVLKDFKVNSNPSKLRQNAMACVALNTCPLALAEGQRYLPSLITKIEDITKKYNLQDEGITIRMTGCPNGCARPYLAEIAFVGKSLGHYNMYLGGDPIGSRLNTLYKESLNESEILEQIDGLFSSFSKARKPNQSFGDFIDKELC